VVNREIKSINHLTNIPTKIFGNLAKKEECDNIIRQWQFQVSKFKGRGFLELNDNSIVSSYSKGRAWMKHIGHSSSLYTQVTRLITNHAPIGDYHYCFFP